MRSLTLCLLPSYSPSFSPCLPETLTRLSTFQSKSSRHPIAVLISSTRDRTPPGWFALQEQLPPSRPLNFLLANSLEDAYQEVVKVMNVLKDEGKRQAQNQYFASLLSSATAPEAVEEVGRTLFRDKMGVEDEKELWRVLAMYGYLGRVGRATREGVLDECPIERETGQRLVEFLDGLGTQE